MPISIDGILQLSPVIGPTGAVLLYLVMNARKRQEPAENPVKELVSKLDDINSRLIRVEAILEERK